MTESATLDKISRVKAESLRAIAANVEKEIGSLSGRLAAARTRQGELVSERSALIIPARSKKDEAAQTRMCAIDEELGPLSRDLSDDESALATLREQLSSLQNRVARAEWDESRECLIKQLEASLKGNPVRKLKAAIEEVRDQFSRINQEADDLVKALMRFDDQRLRSEWNDVDRIKGGITKLLEAMFFEIAPETSFLNRRTRDAVLATDWDGYRRGQIERAIQGIQDLESPA